MRYVRIIIYFTRMCLMRETLFRTNFIIRIFTDLAWLFGTLVFLKIITGRYESIAGWNVNTLYILFGTHYIINYLMTAFFIINGIMLGPNINGGMLDQVLLKPVPAIFAVSFGLVDLSSFVQIFIGGVMVWWGCTTSMCEITLLSFVIYLIQIICGVLILYGMLFSLMYLAFWFRRTQGLEQIYYSTYDFRSFPAEIYPVKVRLIFTVIIPLTLVANPAAKTLVFGPSLIGLVSSITAAIVWVGISGIILSRGLWRYRGAGA